jgi:pentapeptide MXKDX repeat protein
VKTLLAMMVAGCMSLGMAGAYAGDMKKDEMKKDSMTKKDSMAKKDSMTKQDPMKKDAMGKSEMKK